MITAVTFGLSLGCIYGFVAIGFALIHRTTGVMNFAQGAFVMLGGMGAGYSSQEWGLSFPLAALVGVACAALAGLVLVLAVVIPLWERTAVSFVTILGTLLFLVAAENAILNLMGSQPRSVAAIEPSFVLEVSEVRIQSQSIWIFTVAILVAVSLTWYINRTSTGRAMRAVATDKAVARQMGVDPRRIAVVAFLIAAVIGGIGGVLAAPLQFAAWNSAHVYNIKGFIAAVAGGLLDIRAAFVGGLIIGVLEALIVTYGSSAYLDVVLLGILLIFLMVRPNGLFSRPVAVKY